MSDRIFYFAFIFSLLIHISVLGYLSLKKYNIDIFKKQPQIEVVYDVVQPSKSESKNEMVLREDAIIDRPAKKENMPLLSMRKDLVAEGPQVKDVSKMMADIGVGKNQTPEIKTLESQHKISIPMVTAEKISNPQYLTYNQTIRQQIMQRAYRYVDHADFQNGEVYLTFILTRNGDLRDINIIEAKTSANDYLHASAKRSVQDASPFPPFPQDLNYPELTFNVIISFEVGQ